MKNNDIYRKIMNILPPKESYIVFLCEDEKCYFGKDDKNNIIFAMESSSIKLPPIIQESKSLFFAFNKKCDFIIENTNVNKIIHLLICKDSNNINIEAFIRLTRAFSIGGSKQDDQDIAKLFSSLSSLFDKERAISEKEVQGLFAELYTILHFNSIGCNIDSYWQTQNKMNFDFYINDKKRIEVKSTTKTSRIHHFKHSQLLSEIYDIIIVSIMLQKSDYGLSLMDLIDKIKDLFSDNYISKKMY